MDEMLFHNILRNVGVFLTLSFTSVIYVHTHALSSMRNIILCISLIFNLISLQLIIKLLKKHNQLKSIPKLLFVCNIILMFYTLNLLFKNKK